MGCGVWGGEFYSDTQWMVAWSMFSGDLLCLSIWGSSMYVCMYVCMYFFSCTRLFGEFRAFGQLLP